MSKTDKEKLQGLLLTDPATVAESLFNSVLWQKQREIIKSVWNNPRTAVRSCNSGGKSRVAAVITLLYLLTFKPSRVITTAPTFTQVEEILWKEIHSLYHSARMKIGGQLNQTSLEMGTIAGRPWDAMGISTNEVNRFQGFKSPHLLVILDEALGVAPEIWQAMEGLQPHRILAIGNPLDANGDFYNCFSSDLWNKITINGEECVEWQEKHGKIPGLISREWVNERKHEWGHKSPLYQARVLGEFPTESSDTLISRAWVDKARRNNLDEKEEDEIRVLANDVASKHGDCENVIGYRYGHTVKDLEGFFRISMTETRDKLSDRWNRSKAQSVVVDADGIGEGMPEFLAQMQIPCWAFHGGYGQKAIDINRFKNLRSQFYWIVARKFEKGLYDVTQLSDKAFEILKNQLCCIKVKPPDAMGRIQIETKEDLMARGIKSPDYADTFVLLEYGFYMGKYQDVMPFAYR